MSEEAIQFKPAHQQTPDGYGWESGELVPVLDPNTLPEAEQDELRREIWSKIAEVCDQGTVKRTGEFVLLVSYLTGRSGFSTQAEL